MDFVIADTFTDSLARLTGDEQRAAKTTAFDLQLNPVNPGMQLHRIDKSRDRNFWSARVSQDIRLILHRTEQSLLLCFVGHHDAAYAWAERRRLETHPKTGAAQLVEVRERVEEIVVPVHVPAAAQPAPRPLQPPLFGAVADDVLLGYGVPVDWLEDVRRATEDTLLELAEHLPAEAAEALLEVATGGVLRPAALVVPAGPQPEPFVHPDAQRRFRAVEDAEELARAFEYPWDRWMIFLHPAQRAFVDRVYSGPARVAGSAGTGKTIVALHRAVTLARRHPHARVLLTTFSFTLANALQAKLRRLVSNEPSLGERIDVEALDAVGERLYRAHLGRAQVATSEAVRGLLAEASNATPESPFSVAFLAAEWERVVDAWQLDSWESYRDVTRTGRRTRLREPQRAALWNVFERVRAALEERSLVTHARMFSAVAAVFASGANRPYDFIVVDEAQDVSVPQLRFLSALGGERPEALFFAGDLGQRIFQQPFSWKALGVDVRGRSRTLRINYRTSHQIRTQADRLLAPELADMDGNVEERRGTTSTFNGPSPEVAEFDTPGDECEAIAAWLGARVAEGIVPHEIGVFVRSAAQVARALRAVELAGLAGQALDDRVDMRAGAVAIGTMHLAKGLEFRAVVVMACEDDVIPLQARIESAEDEAELQEVYNTERHLLYVACTRARDHLLVTAGGDASEFLADLQAPAMA